MLKVEMLGDIYSISEQFEDVANEAINNFDSDYFTLVSVTSFDESKTATFKIAIHSIETEEPKGTFSFTLPCGDVVKLAKVLSIMFLPLSDPSQGHG